MKLALTFLFVLITAEAYLAPFTKVEESFNLQATYDLINQVSRFDHLDFPGVVPRTFFGATILSVIAWPIVQLLPQLSSIDQQVLVRVILSGLVVLSLGRFGSGVKALFGQATATTTLLLLLCQFHIVFWSSRTLPNTLALPWVELGLSHWLKSLSRTNNRAYHLNWMIIYLTFAGVVFRFEAGIMLVILVTSEWLYGNIKLVSALKQVAATASLSLIATVPLDSYLWNQWIWPEGMVFYFNAVLNKSSEWGTLPSYAYFASFLPRLLLISYPLSLFGFITDARIRRVLFPMYIYVGLFSLLPHKEWRFIMYTIPVFTAAAAATISNIMAASRRSWIYRIISFVIVGGVLFSFLTAMIMFQISRANYPGGEALYNLHVIEKDAYNVNVHMDVETAMTGASLYGQSNSRWIYSKNEAHTTQQDMIDAKYTHLITAHPEKFDTSVFEVIDEAYGIDKIQLKPINDFKNSLKTFDLNPIQFRMKPKIYTLKLIQPQKTWLQNTLRKHPIVLYSKTYCPYCRGAKQLIAKYCNEIKIIELDKEKDGRVIQQALYDLTGQSTVPNFFKDGKSLGGFDRLSELDRQGKLAGICDSKNNDDALNKL